jgi:hypothetical protein
MLHSGLLTRRPEFKFFNTRKLRRRHSCYKVVFLVFFWDEGTSHQFVIYISKSSAYSGTRGIATVLHVLRAFFFEVFAYPESVEWGKGTGSIGEYPCPVSDPTSVTVI